MIIFRLPFSALLLFALLYSWGIGASEEGKKLSSNLEISEWNLIRTPSGRVEGRFMLKNRGKEAVETGGFRLRLCTSDGREVSKSEWVRFSEIKPGGNQVCTIKPFKAEEYNVLWLDLRYYLLDVSDGKGRTLGSKGLKGAMDDEIDSDKLDSLNESFLGLGVEMPLRHNVANYKKTIERLNQALSQIMETAEGAAVEERRDGQINIHEVKVEPDGEQSFAVTIRLYNDDTALPPQRLEITLRFLKEDGTLVKTLVHTVPGSVALGSITVTIPKQMIPVFSAWDANYRY